MIKLGQNFLTSTNIAKNICNAASPASSDIVLEIGPGKGMLTEQLLSSVAKVVAVEKDPELISFLREKFTSEIENGRLELIEKDILEFNETTVFKNGFNYKLVANIPYYITGKIIRKFLESSYQPTSMILMMQKEVGERILAKDNKESILSISIKAYGEPKIVKNVPAKHFIPKPKVDSVVIKIDNISRNFFIKNKIDEKKFFAMVKRGFINKRKMLKKNLGLNAEILKKCNLAETIRAEDLKLEDWKKLYKMIQIY